MKTLPIAPIGDDEDDVRFQTFLNECDNHSNRKSSAVSYPSTLDRFKLDGPQSEKQKMSKFMERTLQRNAGFIEAGRMKGNVGDQSLDDLLRFINGDAADRVVTAADDKKLSPKAGKGLRPPNDAHLKIQSAPNGERIRDSLNCVAVREKLGEIGSIDSDESESDVVATRVGLHGCMLNGSTRSEELKEEEDIIPETVVVSDVFGSDFEKTETVNGSFVAEGVVCVDARSGNFRGETGVEDAAFESTGIEFSRRRKAIVDAVEFPSISSSRSDGAETVRSSEDEDDRLGHTDRFVVVQKRKRNRFSKTAESRSGRESPASSVIEYGSKTPIQSRARDTLSVFLSAKLGKSKFLSSNRDCFHRPWNDVYRDKSRRRSDLTPRSSGSENSSTCSVPILKSTTPSFVGKDETDVKCAGTNVTETIFHPVFDRRNSTCALKNCDTPDDTLAVGISMGNSGDGIVAEARTSKNRGAVPEQAIRSVKISSSDSSSSAISSRPVVFLDARRSPTEKIDVTFGFDADWVSASSKCDVSDDLVGGIDLAVATDGQSMCMPDSHYVNGVYDYCSLPCVNQFFEDTVLGSRSSVNMFPNHLHHTVPSHLPVAYNAFGSYPGFPYALPTNVPVGIVPPYVVYEYSQVNSASADFPTYESVNDETSSLSKPDFSALDVREKHECEMGPFEDDLEPCSADVEAQLDSAVSSVACMHPNVFHLAEAQRFLLRDFQAVISQCTQFSPNMK